MDTDSNAAAIAADEDRRDEFDALCCEILDAEATPSYAALCRWCERYPQHQDELMRFFAAWAIAEASARHEPVVMIDEDALAKRMVEYAMKLLAKRSAPPTG